MPKELELITCPNPKCRRKIERPIVVSDVSKTPVERYCACPHCFFKLDVVSAQFLGEEEKRRKDEPTVEKLERKGKAPPGCPHHFGYLASRAKDAPIPQECLICPSVLDCIKGINDSL